MNYSTCIDWLAFTMPAEQRQDRNPLWASGKREIRGLYGYDSGVQTDEGVMLFLHSTKPDMGIYIQYGGSALQNLAPITPLHVLTYHMGNGHAPKRLDLALDVFDMAITAGEIETLFNAGKVITRAKQGKLIREDKSRLGEGYYIGSTSKRKKLLCCYNKGIETRSGEDWFRFELRAYNTAAPAVAETLYTRGDNPDLIIGLIKGFAHVQIDRLESLWDIEALKAPHHYTPQPDAALEQAFKTIPKWVARLMDKYGTVVLSSLLEQILNAYAETHLDERVEYAIRTTASKPPQT